MNSKLTKTTFVLLLCLPELVLNAQSTTGSNYFLYSIIGVSLLAFFFIIFNVADNLLMIEAKQSGITGEKVNMGLFPKLREFFQPKLPTYTDGHPVKILQKGHNILLEGEAPTSVNEGVQVSRFAVKPTDFLGIQPIPKMLVEVGDKVKVGDPIFFDKKRPDIKYVAPVSGEVLEIKRGAKRAIAEVIIQADREATYRQLEVPAATASREEKIDFLKDSGAWTLLRQRPYNVVADPDQTPRDIFISTFDTAPLAPDSNFVVAGQEEAFQKGLDLLASLTDGKVHLGLSSNGKTAPSSAFVNASGVEKYFFKGKHPAGNVGVQMHHIAPVSGADQVWTLGVQEVISLGNLWISGHFDSSRVIAIGGAEVKEPTYVRTSIGANIGELTKGNINSENVRYISGDVLSGTKVEADGFLGFYDDQLSVITEGDYYELFGWLLPFTPRPTISNTYPNALFPGVRYKGDTNTHGEKRAFVVTNDYETVMPMDIYTQQLMKSILVNDFESMEGLGIHELVEEDVALCEFVCVSKQPLQKILRQGLETMREQG